MNRTMIKASYRFVQDVPAFGLIGDVAVASTGRTWSTAPTHYIIIAYTDVATVGMGKHLFSDPDRMSVASGQPVLDLHEFVLPTLDDFRRLRQEENIARKTTKEDRARMHIDTFLKEVYSLSKIGDTDTAGIKIFDFLDRILLDGFFGVCNDILSTVNVDLLDTKLMRSFLSITVSAKRKLPARAALYMKIEVKMIALRGEDKTRKIIGTLA
jgi:hypothetical protein